MKNFIQEGEIIEFANSGSAIASGDVVVIGEMVGVACGNIATGESGPVETCGVFELAKATGSAWTIGQKLFWDKTNLRFTGTASSDADLVAGYAFKAADSADATGYVKLCGPAVPKVVAAVAAEATVDGSDAATTQALANALKAKVNALIAALKASGVMDN